MRKPMVSVIGGHDCTDEVAFLAENIGKVIAESGYVLVCGGLEGVMEAVCKGCKTAGGETVGIIPGNDKTKANPYVDIVIPTDMGFSRNTLVAGAADIVVALPGEYGTMSEITFALIGKKKVYSFGNWNIKDVIELTKVEELEELLANR